MLTITFIYLSVWAASYFGVELFRRWSLKREIIDIPNERSSHTVPTPRGAGVVVCAVSLTAFVIYTFLGNGPLHWSYLVGSLIVAGISLVDDIKTISPFLRILFHSLAAFLIVREVGGFETVAIPFEGITEIGLIGKIAAFLWIVWLINAYNFMDGIDGIAGIQAVIAGIGWSLIGYFLGATEISFYGAVLALASLGFLIHNWQPAKIFLGDVGSAFLGFSYAVLPVFLAKEGKDLETASKMPWVAVILVWFFVFDSVYTFFRRLLRREKVWQPHREHLYQKLVIAGLTHSSVTILYGTLSAILTAALVLAVKFGIGLEKMILPLILGETLFLILYKNKIVR